MDLQHLSIREKIGQKFIVGVNSNNIDLIINLIKNYSIGGVILYKANYRNYDEMLSVIKRLKLANSSNKIPLFIAIDQEGGRVNRMPSEFKNIKNTYDMSKKDSSLVYQSANVTGKMLYDMGINMNLAPVMDIYDDNGSKLLYKRCFYGGVDEVSLSGKNYIKGLKENNIISVVKHFPGHGSSKMDSHFVIPYVYNYKKVLEKHILPFENVIKSGVDAIMVSHLVIRKLTGGLPASISFDFINEYLRKKNNFDGLVITDDINMVSRNIFYKFNYLKKLFVSSSDIVLVKISNSENNIIDRFIKYVNNSDDCIKMIDSSVQRIVDIKKKYMINDNIDYVGCDVSKINSEIENINSLLDE